MEGQVTADEALLQGEVHRVKTVARAVADFGEPEVRGLIPLAFSCPEAKHECPNEAI